MLIVKEPISGTIEVDDDAAALRLGPNSSEARVYLSYALVTQGPEQHILPSTLLDDWGNEIGHLELYNWIREYGLHFPRAELFGANPSGTPVQYFLRDQELFVNYPVYAFAENDAPINSGVLLRAILIPDEAIDVAQPAMAPLEFSMPLREGQVTWWRVNPQHVGLGFLNQAPSAPE